MRWPAGERSGGAGEEGHAVAGWREDRRVVAGGREERRVAVGERSSGSEEEWRAVAGAREERCVATARPTFLPLPLSYSEEMWWKRYEPQSCGSHYFLFFTTYGWVPHILFNFFCF